MLSSRFTTFGRHVCRSFLRSYSQTATKFSLRGAEGERLTSADFLKQISETDIPEAEKIVVPKQALNALTAEYDELVKQCAEAEDYKDRYRRAIAETENVRRRMQRQIEDTKSFVMQGFCKDLLEVADILNTALDTMEKADDGDVTTTHKNLEGMREGVQMTKNVLLKVFSKHGIHPIHPHGEKFDPHLHDALFEVPAKNAKHPPGHVHEVLKTGYRLHERPIRPAKVSVVKE